MSDIVEYILVLGLIIIPLYAGVKIGMKIIGAIYENQSVILSYPFP